VFEQSDESWHFGGDYLTALATAIGDSGLICGTHVSARRALKAGLPVFMYNFDVPWAILPTVLKASHASEMSHVFGNPYLPMPDPGSQAVGVAMNAFWSQFATAGDPKYSGAPATWPGFVPDANDDDERLQFDPGFETVKDFKKTQCAFWRELYDQAYAR
jgi:carboxylesterase type B